MGRPFDGSRDQLGKEIYIEGVAAQMRVRDVIAPVDVDHVAEGLEGVKGDAERQEDIEMGDEVAQAGGLEQRAGAVSEEVKVFEIAEQPDQKHDGDREPGAAGARIARAADAATGLKGHQGLSHDQEDVFPPPAHVEVVAGGQQQPQPIPVGQRKIRQHHEGEENGVFEGIK